MCYSPFIYLLSQYKFVTTLGGRPVIQTVVGLKWDFFDYYYILDRYSKTYIGGTCWTLRRTIPRLLHAF